jgi:hypothetical protein
MLLASGEPDSGCRWNDVPVVSRLEAVMSLAMGVYFACLLAGWGTAAAIAGVPFLVLVLAFAARVVYRRAHGKSWTDSWGRTPPAGE